MAGGRGWPAWLAAVALTAPAITLADAQVPSDQPGGAAARSNLEALVQEVSREVEQLRGWTFTATVPTVRVSLADAMTFIGHQFDAALTPDELARYEAMLRVAGIMPPGVDYRDASLELLESQVSAYYDLEQKRLSLVERPDPLPVVVERSILAHELTHALDDQRLDLSTLLRQADLTSDARFARLALVEGSAFALMSHYGAMLARTGRVNPSELAAWAAQEMQRASALADLPRGLNEWLASYICGAAFLTKRDLVALASMQDNREIGASLLAAAARPPRSTEQVLHPEKYWDPAHVDEPTFVEDESVEEWLQAGGRAVIHRDTLGELMTAVLTEARDFPKDLGKLMSATAWTNLGAIGWGGDRFYLLAPRGSKKPRSSSPAAASQQGVWVTAWDSPKEQREFIQNLAHGFAPKGYAVEPVGKKAAVVFFGISEAERRGLARRLRSTGLRFSRDGVKWVP